MAETLSPSHPLADQALSRLRKLADGNGLAPDKIELIEAQEKIYTLTGITHLVPFCEPSGARYPGPVRGKDRKMLPDPASLRAAVENYQKEFIEKRGWLPAAMKELEAAPGGGWGLDGARITLPEKSAIFAGSETCPGCQGRKVFTCDQCQGQGYVICAQCQGRGMEQCWNCAGRGVNPSHPDQPCLTCHGKRFAPCRYCHSSGKLVCPTCQGRRGITCPQCQGAGFFTNEIGLACGAAIKFDFKGDEMPSGLRRGLDRLGVANLAKGHADIRLIPNPPENSGGENAGKAPDPTVIRHEALLPYADLKMRFGGGRVVLVNVFGKRAVLMGVPAFLDESLQPWRERLKKAARGMTPLEGALEARAMRDAFTLTIGGKAKVENLRRIYPSGLTPKAAQEILLDMRRALNQFTRHIRLAAASFGGALGAALLAGFILMPLHAQLVQARPVVTGLLLDLFVLALVGSVAWTGLGAAVQFRLKRRFPDIKISMHSNAGHIGKIMLGGIILAWLLALVLAPVKPPWFLSLLAYVHLV